MSTDKVYGDALNRLNLVEKELRWDYADPEYANRISETFSIDHSMHPLSGLRKRLRISWFNGRHCWPIPWRAPAPSVP
jgi:hypothetical protein